MAKTDKRRKAKLLRKGVTANQTNASFEDLHNNYIFAKKAENVAKATMGLRPKP